MATAPPNKVRIGVILCEIGWSLKTPESQQRGFFERVILRKHWPQTLTAHL
jgi:hypothetical protein